MSAAPRSETGRLRFVPSIDGLRALAVTAVVVYHIGASWLPGGYLGVDLFLVISGYLITSILIGERERDGKIDLRRFWARRARRLLPALILMIAVTLLAFVILHPGEVARLRWAVGASLGYVANWYFVFADIPYFEQFGRPSSFEHLWSLAVEEQFYILWPPVLLAALVLLRRRAILVLVLGGGAVSTLIAWRMFEPFSDPSRIYYGTDTRAVGLLVGVAAALCWPLGTCARDPRRTVRLLLDGIGLIGLLGVTIFWAQLEDIDEQLYRGGFLVFALAAALLLVPSSLPGSLLGRCLAAPPLRWVGTRSYGIYLWHWPVLMLTREGTDVSISGTLLITLQIVLTVALAAASYRFVETPVRRDGLAAVRRALGIGRDTGSRLSTRVAAWTAVAVICGLVPVVALLPGSTPKIPGLTPPQASAAPETTPTGPERSPSMHARAGSKPTVVNVAATFPKGRVLAFGDSVMLSAAHQLQAALGPKALIDAVVARQFRDAVQPLLTKVKATKPPTVIIHLGTNGYIPFPALKEAMEGLHDVPLVVLVNTYSGKKWERSANDGLAYAAKTWRNVTLVDWHKTADAAKGLLVDGAHPNPEGAKLYATTIASAVLKAQTAATP